MPTYKINKNSSLLNINNYAGLNFECSDVAKKNKIIQIVYFLEDKNINYCPVCKTKNMPKDIYLAFDLIFCSTKCRNFLCNGINIEEVRKFRNFKKV